MEVVVEEGLVLEEEDVAGLCVVVLFALGRVVVEVGFVSGTEGLFVAVLFKEG